MISTFIFLCCFHSLFPIAFPFISHVRGSGSGDSAFCRQLAGHWGQPLLRRNPQNSSTCCATLNVATSERTTSAESPLSELMLYWGYAVVGMDMGLAIPDPSAAPFPCNCSDTFSFFAPCQSQNGSIQNFATPEIDLGFIYGNTPEQEVAVRESPTSCRLKLTDAGQFPRSCNRSVFPAFANDQFGPAYARCSADPRSGIVPQVLAIHTLLAREHNRRCARTRQLYYGDRFSAVKREMISLVQKITMYEWLPSVVGGLDRIPPFVYREQHGSSATHEVQTLATSAEFLLVLNQLWLEPTSGMLQLLDYSGNVEELSLDSFFYDWDAMAMTDNAMCRILSGSRGTTMHFVAPELTRPWATFEKQYFSTCQYSYAYGLPSYKDAVRLTLQTAASSYPTVSTSDLSLVVNITDFTDDAWAISKISSQFGIPSTNETALADAVDLWLGLMLERHVVAGVRRDNDSIIGPLARFILVSQLVRWRDNDPAYFENLANAGGVMQGSLTKVLSKNCAKFVQYNPNSRVDAGRNSMYTQGFDLLKENLEQTNVADNSTGQDISIVVIVVAAVFLVVFFIVVFYGQPVKK